MKRSLTALLLLPLSALSHAALPDGLELRKNPDEARRAEVQSGSTVCPSLCLGRLDFGNRQDYYFIDAEGAARYLISERRPENAEARFNPPILDYQHSVPASAAKDCGGDGWGFRYGDSVATLASAGFSLDLRYDESGVGRVLVLDLAGQPLRTSPAATGDRAGLDIQCVQAREFNGEQPPIISPGVPQQPEAGNSDS